MRRAALLLAGAATLAAADRIAETVRLGDVDSKQADKKSKTQAGKPNT